MWAECGGVMSGQRVALTCACGMWGQCCGSMSGIFWHRMWVDRSQIS